MTLTTTACGPAISSAMLPYTFVEATMLTPAVLTPAVGSGAGAQDTSVVAASARASGMETFFTVRACLCCGCRGRSQKFSVRNDAVAALTL